MSKPKVLLIGWDAADWKIIRPLLDAGQMPNLTRLMEAGVHGNIATIYPVLSPMIWTSIATGKRAYKHGVHGFIEPLPDGSGVRPVTILSRHTKAVWNILNQNGWRSIVVGWWPSHPAEPLNGVMVSNHFQRPVGAAGDMPPLPTGTVHPAALAASLADLRVHPMELEGEFIRMFVPEYEKVDQAKDKRLHVLGNTIAETMSVHAAATELLATQPWDFAAVYYDALDHFAHGFMHYHPPRLPTVSEKDYAIYQHVVDNAYRYHDAMLGTLLKLADEHTTVVLMSDHGFHPDHLRPSYIPAEPAGPAVEHRHYGILCLKGPAIRSNERIYGASVLDICPTILSVCGLPPGKDMDGKVLTNTFREEPRIDPVDSWDSIAGDAGTHPQNMRLDPVASAQAFKQLVELGYVAPPSPNVREQVDEAAVELKYNLARAYFDGNRFREAGQLAEELWQRWPKQHRFGVFFIECLSALNEVKRRGEAVEELARRVERFAVEAQDELRQLEAKRAATKDKEPEEKPLAFGGPTREQYRQRELQELAHTDPGVLAWFRASQALLEKSKAAARQHLETLLSHGLQPSLQLPVANAMARLGELETARRILEGILADNPEDASAHAQLAVIHVKGRRWKAAIGAAADSLSLLYFQPGLHALLGRAMMETGQLAEAEKELHVALAQHPRQPQAHELLAKLYRKHLNRPADAFAHEGRARSLRLELREQRRKPAPAAPSAHGHELSPPATWKIQLTDKDQPFSPDVKPQEVITVVSGLPRSGTSMMMQILAAGGMEPLTDDRRIADEDNPLGYFEFQKAAALAQDAAWLPQARGKVVKIVAQLLPLLPPTEHYQIVFMQRHPDEVVASQKAMLSRQGRRGAELETDRLKATYAAQLERVRNLIDRRANFRMLGIDYAELLSDPAEGVRRVAAFVGVPFENAAAVAAVRPELRRQKAAGPANLRDSAQKPEGE